jgi:HlyD family secretion protein
MAMTQAGTVSRSIQRHAWVGAIAMMVLIAGLGGWAATTELSGAVVASGVLVVDSSVKKVQHPTGGVIGELRVHDGDHVKTGDVVIRLDETVTRANLAIIVKSLNELTARQARLEAEQQIAETIEFPADLTARATEPDVARVIQGEQKLFELRRSARAGQKSQLQERISQLQDEIGGLSGQTDAKKREIELINRELEGVRELWAKRLIPFSRVTELEREAVRLDGERNQVIATIAQSKGKMTETNLQIIQIDQDLRSDSTKELRDTQSKVAELIERKVAAEDQLQRIDIRSPQDGIVHELSVHTVGGVVAPGDQLMLIVPEHDALIVEVRVPPSEIEQLSYGQRASLRFPAFNQRTTPQIDGTVILISPDISHDDKKATDYYLVRVSMPSEEVARLGDVKLIPGMPVEVFIQTTPRTVMSFLLKPMRDQIEKAFREK